MTAGCPMCASIDRNHEEKSDDVLLFIGPEVMQSVQHHVPDRDGEGSQSVADGEDEEVDGGRWKVIPRWPFSPKRKRSLRTDSFVASTP
jgi:hypothetical protein